MIYKNKKEWETSTNKRVSLLGMSGLGKTMLSNMLQSTFSWFHYSIDYRIGTRYLDEHIVDNFKIVSIKDHSNEKYIETGQDTIVLIIQKRKKRLKKQCFRLSNLNVENFEIFVMFVM